MHRFLPLAMAVAALCGSYAPAHAVPTDTHLSSTQKIRQGDKVIVNHLEYDISNGWYVFNEWGVSNDGWIAVLTGCDDDFYMPSRLTVPDDITVEGITIPVVQVKSLSSDKLKTLVLGKNVEVLGAPNNSCLRGCPNLATTIFNDQLKVICDGAFSNLPLTSLDIPASVRYIGNSTFGGCPLEKLSFTDSSDNDGYGLTIGEGAFATCKSLTIVTLPRQTVQVKANAFFRNDKLTGIFVSPGCENIASDNGVLYQKNGDTYDAVCYPRGKEGTSYTFPALLSGGRILQSFIETQSAAPTAPYPSHQITHLDFSQLTAPVVIESNAITAYNVSEITLLNVDSIKDRGFTLNSPAINVGKETRYIHPTAFGSSYKTFNVDKDNPVLLSDTNGSLFERLDDGLRMTRACQPWQITSYSVADNVTEIGEQCFTFCNYLATVNISKTVRRIGKDAFYGDKELRTINIPTDSELDYVDAKALYGFNNGYWFDKQPDGGVYLDKVLYRWKGESSENTRITVKAGTKVLAPYCFSKYASPNEYASGSLYEMTTVSLPSSLEKIYERAFYRDEKLSSIQLPDNLKYIGDFAFASTGLTSVNIPESVEYIGAYAFNTIKSLESLSIGSYYSDYRTVIGEGAFNYCTDAKSLLIGGNVTEIGKSAFTSFARDAEPLDIELPASVETLGDYAFAQANVKRFRIGAGLAKIGYRALGTPVESIYDESSNYIGDKVTLEEIHIEAAVPPVMSGEPNLCDQAIYDQVPLFVPVGKVAEYKAAPGWSQFRRILNEGDDASVEGVRADDANAVSVAVHEGEITVVAPEAVDVTVVSLEGRTVHAGKGSATVSAVPGIYIVSAGTHVSKHIVR